MKRAERAVNLHPLAGIPPAVLQPAERTYGPNEAQLALLHLQGERHAGVLWAQRHGGAGLGHLGSDE